MTISFIIINYNTPELTCKCISSIQEHVRRAAYEIIVVDNCSSPENFRQLESLCPQGTQILRNAVNMGFGLGNNIGAQQAKGDFLCFINSDVELYEDCVNPLCEYMQTHGDTGCAGTQQHKSAGMPVPTFKHNMGIRHELFGDGIFEKILPGRFPKRKDFTRKEPFCVPQISGSLMVFPRKCFWEAGGFDSNLFLYYEEYDLGKRLQAMGLKSLVFPQYGYLHLHTASTNQMRKAAYRELVISKLYVYDKFHGIILSDIFRGICLLKTLLKPRKWFLLPLYIKRSPLALSLKHAQKGVCL